VARKDKSFAGVERGWKIMKRLKRYVFIVVTVLSGYTVILHAQSVRSLVNGGNDLYDAKKYTDAEVAYRKSLEKDKDLLQGKFNLGDAVYKQNHFDEAIQEYTAALGKTTDPNMQAKIYHNIGNAYCSSNQYPEGVKAYTNALKCNPKDEDTRYNLAYALKKIQEQQQQKKQDDKKDKKNNDKDKQDQTQNQKQDQKQNQQQEQQQNQQQNQQQSQQQKQQPERKISKQEAERILEALKNDEKNTQKKMQKRVPVRLNVDKDW
jgi:Ca-activated chloride channel homolog